MGLNSHACRFESFGSVTIIVRISIEWACSSLYFIQLPLNFVVYWISLLSILILHFFLTFQDVASLDFISIVFPITQPDLSNQYFIKLVFWYIYIFKIHHLCLDAEFCDFFEQFQLTYGFLFVLIIFLFSFPPVLYPIHHSIQLFFKSSYYFQLTGQK